MPDEPGVLHSSCVLGNKDSVKFITDIKTIM